MATPELKAQMSFVLLGSVNVFVSVADIPHASNVLLDVAGAFLKSVNQPIEPKGSADQTKTNSIRSGFRLVTSSSHNGCKYCIFTTATDNNNSLSLVVIHKQKSNVCYELTNVSEHL